MAKKDDNKANGSPNGVQEINILDYVSILLKWRRFFAINLGITILLAVAVALLLPRWYKSTASILPPKEQGMMNPLGAASSLLRGITNVQRTGPGLSLGGGAYNYLAIMKSRTSMEAVVKKFNLVEVYGVSNASVEKAIKELESNVTFDVQPEDNLTVEVLDQDRQRAADIANEFVEILNSISVRLGTQEARNNREFIERRMAKIYEDLHGAEEALKNYQEKSGTMIVPEQNSASISNLAELYAMKARKEIEVGLLERTTTKENSLLQQLKAELQEISKKVDGLPEAGMESLRLYREVAIQQRILEYVVPLYEQAKVDEQKDVPVILVLDRAVPAERHDRPKRVIIVLLALILGFLLQAFFVFFLEGFRSRKEIRGTLDQKFDRVITTIANKYQVHL